MTLTSLLFHPSEVQGQPLYNHFRALIVLSLFGTLPTHSSASVSVCVHICGVLFPQFVIHAHAEGMDRGLLRVGGNENVA